MMLAAALNSYRTAARFDPNNYEILFHLASASLETGDLHTAAIVLQRANKLYPDDRQVQDKLDYDSRRLFRTPPPTTLD
jgi:cytochrome c-type biogenesis protein CcmH/NrfG